MLLCWGISSQAQEKVRRTGSLHLSNISRTFQIALRPRLQDPSNYWSFEPLKASQVKPGLYKIVNVYYEHTLFGSKDGTSPTNVVRLDLLFWRDDSRKLTVSSCSGGFYVATIRLTASKTISTDFSHTATYPLIPATMSYVQVARQQNGSFSLSPMTKLGSRELVVTIYLLRLRFLDAESLQRARLTCFGDILKQTVSSR